MSTILGGLFIPVMIIAVGIAFLSVAMMVARNYKKCPPNQAMILTGRKRKVSDGQSGTVEQGFRTVVGGAALRMPLLERIDYMSLSVFQSEFSVQKTPNVDGVAVNVDAVANLRISSQPNILAIAVSQLLGKTPEEIEIICKNTLEAQLRQIVGTLTIEDMVRDREKISQQVVNVAKPELEKTGIELVNFNIKGISDALGYIEALGKTKTAQVKRDAEIGEAEAQRESTIKASTARREGEEKKLENDQAIEQAKRDLEVKKADLKVEVDTAQAKAELAGALAKADLQKDLKAREASVDAANARARIEVAEEEAKWAEKKLVTEKIRPAEAEKQASIIKAEGEQQASVIKAEGDKQAAVIKAEATKATAEAEKSRLQFVGEGEALAEAALKRELGLAEAEVVQKKGEAEGAAIQAKLLAEAMGLLKKQEALAQMTPAARTVIILEMLPQIIEHAGDAGEKIFAAMFEQVGAGLARIDSVHMVDLGGGNGNGNGPVANFAMNIPKIVFGALQQLKALGINVDEIFGKLGINMDDLIGVNSPKSTIHAPIEVAEPVS
ncbi:MAG: SPFH domain-containing protein [Patescibacteria group bacterium]